MANNSGIEAAVLAADDQRLKAMTAGDAPALDRLFADELLYTHGSGRTDTKAAYLGPIAAGKVRYSNPNRSAAVVHVYGTTAWLQCHLKINVVRDGTEIPLDNQVLSVWLLDGGQWRMAAFASTPIRA